MTLTELREAWNTESGPIRRAAAKPYVAARGTELATLQQYTRDELVSMVSAARRAGEVDRVLEIDAWLMSEYEPQNITGRLRPGGA